MATNPYIKYLTHSGAQDLHANLANEMVRMYGLEFQYLPRTIINEDELFGDDPLSQFSKSVKMEMYIIDSDGYRGQGDILSKFGLEIRKSLRLSVTRDRFAVHIARFYTEPQVRPFEGDLIYFPYAQKLFEVKFVEHENPFYQFGALLTWDLYCETFDYSSERIDTGNTVIDAIEISFTINMTGDEILLESGDNLLQESGNTLLLEQRVESTQPTANIQLFTENEATYVDWSEVNPFIA